MKCKKLCAAMMCVMFAVLLWGCGKKENFTKITEVDENSRIFEVNYDRVNYDAGDKFWAENNDNWGGGCTAVTKEFSDGHRVVGRNMDLNIADKAAYIVRTNAGEGRYKTVGLAYTYRDYAPYYEEVKEKGIRDEFRNILPFLCDDVMNDQGLHIEVNMRHAECDFAGNDQFSLQGTNPAGERRVHMFELPRYIAENCKTVAEAKAYVDTLDIYSKADYWNYCFLISDSTESGETHAALLEFSAPGFLGEVFNTYVPDTEPALAVNWIDEEDISEINWIGIGQTNREKYCRVHALAQANFYLNWWAYQREDMKSGEGRFMTVQSLIDDVDSKSQMYDLMRRISYSWFYTDYDTCKKYHFDPRSENLGEFQGGTYDFVFDEEYEDLLRQLFNDSSAEILAMTREQKEQRGGIWESTFTEVVDVTERTIEVRFFENEALRYLVTMDGIEHLPRLAAPEYSELPPYDFLPVSAEPAAPEETAEPETEEDKETEEEAEPVPQKTEYRFLMNENHMPSACFAEEPFENEEGTEAYYILDEAYISAHFGELENEREPGYVVFETKIKAPEGAVKAVHESGSNVHEFQVKDGTISLRTRVGREKNGALSRDNVSYLSLTWLDASGNPIHEEPEEISVMTLDPFMAKQMDEVRAGRRRFLLNVGNLPETCFEKEPEEIEGKQIAVYPFDYEYLAGHFEELANAEEEPAIILETKVKAPEGAVKAIHRNGHEDPEFEVQNGFVRLGSRIRKDAYGDPELINTRLHMIWVDAEGKQVNLSPEELTIRLEGGPAVNTNADHLDPKCFTKAPEIKEEDGVIDITYTVDRQYVESHFNELGGGKPLGVVIAFPVPEGTACYYNCMETRGMQEDVEGMNPRILFASGGKVQDKLIDSNVYNFKNEEGQWVGSTKLIVRFLADDSVPNEVVYPEKGTLTPGYTGIAGPGEQVKEGEKRLLPKDYFTRPEEYDEKTGTLDLWISDARCRQKEDRFYDNTISVAYRYPEDWELVSVDHPSFGYDKDSHEVWVDVHNMEKIGRFGGWTGYYAFTYGGLGVEKPVITFRKPDGSLVDVTMTIRYHRS